MTDLSSQKCVPCQVGAPKLEESDINRFLSQVDNWEKEDNPDKITKVFELKDFKRALEFANKVGSIAEEEGHHPNLYLYNYKKVKVEIWTHKIEGLHKNDFILASKIDEL